MDLSKLSDAELQALYSKPADLSSMSDDDLKKAYEGTKPKGVIANAMDFAKSVPRGVLQGLGNFGSMMAGAGDPDVMSAMAWSGQDPVGAVNASKDVAEKAVTQGINKAQEATGVFPEPQGRAGKFGAAIGEGVGNPLSYVGPGGLPLKVGSAVLSSVGGEGGRQAAEGTKFEKAASIGGAVLGGIAGAKVLTPSATKAAVPTYRELKDAATADYNAARNSGLELHPQGVASFASKVEQDLSGPNYGFTGGQFGDAPKTFAVLDTLQKPPAGAVVTASNIDAVRKNLGRLSRETLEGKPTPDAAAASVALENLGKYTENIPQSHILAGDAADYVRATKQGNANYSAAQRVRTFDAKINKAENNAAGGIATSLENQIKSQARTILNNPKAQRGFSAEELAALQRINDGTLGSNILRQAGRGGAGVIPIMGQIAAAPGVFAAGGPAATIAQVLVAGGLYGARKGSEAITKSRAEKLAEMLAKRSPEYERRAAAVPPPDASPGSAAIARALLGQF